jgi:hypothetical protein
MSASAAGATRAESLAAAPRRADPPALPALPAARSRAEPRRPAPIRPGCPAKSRAAPILLGRLVPVFAASLDSRAPTGMLLAIENTS